MTGLVWTTPLLAAAAPVAGILAAWIARRGLAARRPVPAWSAALARGGAVCAALLAAAGPTFVSERAPRGVILAASAADVAQPPEADNSAVWPTLPAANAAEAASLLRAARSADAPASLAISYAAQGNAPGDGDAAAFVPSRGTAVVLAGPRDAALPPDADSLAPPVSLLIPAGLADDVPFRIFIDSGAARLGGGAATLTIDAASQSLRLPEDASRIASAPVRLGAGRHIATLHLPDGRVVVRWFDVAPPPRVLVVSKDGTEPPLARRLRAHGMTVDVASAATADLAPRADVVVLGPGAAGSGARTAAMRTATGTGLLVMGGRGVEGLARFRGTSLEPLLPVTLPVAGPPAPPQVPPEPPAPKPDTPTAPKKPVIDEGDRNALRVALLLVLDRSGSMSDTKLVMARESVLAAARSLSAEDEVGVLAFDDGFEWIAPFQAATDYAALRRRLLQIRAEGGTNFLPALREAYAAIAARPAGIRHVVLVTDGQTRSAVFRDLVESGANAGITLSAVAVGDGADEDLLGRLATWGRGRLYPATDPQHLPQVITLDAKKFALAERDERRRALEDVAVPPRPDTAEPAPADAAEPKPDIAQTTPEQPKASALRTPRAVADAPFLAEIRLQQAPGLPHAESVTLRGAAFAPLVWSSGGSDAGSDGAPALVLGRAGEGRVAVLAADAFSADAAAWWDWDDAGPFTAQLVRSLAPDPSDAGPRNAAITRTADGGAWCVVESDLPGTLAVTMPGAGPAAILRCEPRGVVATGRLPAEADAALDPSRPVFAEWTPDGGTPERLVFAAAPRTTDAGAPRTTTRRLAALSGAAAARDIPAPPDGAPVEERRAADEHLLAVAAALLVAEALARRESRG